VQCTFKKYFWLLIAQSFDLGMTEAIFDFGALSSLSHDNVRRAGLDPGSSRSDLRTLKDCAASREVRPYINPKLLVLRDTRSAGVSSPARRRVRVTRRVISKLKSVKNVGRSF